MKKKTAKKIYFERKIFRFFTFFLWFEIKFIIHPLDAMDVKYNIFFSLSQSFFLFYLACSCSCWFLLLIFSNKEIRDCKRIDVYNLFFSHLLCENRSIIRKMTITHLHTTHVQKSNTTQKKLKQVNR